ncbi:MAG: hypothetical protein H8E44_08095 [Planctomycetes bacterium]|nr:hypothetical protein [Planctomycetota bacterium]
MYTTAWLISALLMPSAEPALAAWHVPACHHRLPLTAGADRAPVGRRTPIVITGEDLYRLAGAVQVAVDSIRLVGPDGKPRAMQVDQRDRTGRLGQDDNARLDYDDEIAFVVDYPESASATYWLYWDKESVSASISTEPTIEIDRDTGIEYVDVSLDNGSFWVGLKGSSSDTPTKNQLTNYGRGGITELKLHGKPFTNIRSSYGFHPVRHPFGSGPGDCKWSLPKVVARGPIRTVVEMVCDDFKVLDDKKQPTVRGRVIHEWALYENLPVLDARMLFTYKATMDHWSAGFAFPMYVGGPIDGHESLFVPLLDSACRVAVPEDFRDAWYPTLYQTPVPEEGWFAWTDAPEKHGLAVFYERMATIRKRATWVSHRPAHNPEVRIRLTPNETTENNVTWRHRRLSGTDQLRYELRLVGLSSDDGVAIRTAYHIWASPIEEGLSVGFPETLRQHGLGD